LENQIEMESSVGDGKVLFGALHAVIQSHSQFADRKSMLIHILKHLPHVHPIEFKDKDGLTPVLLAAKLGYHDDVGLLMWYGATLLAGDNNGFTALHWAVAGCHEDVVRMLLLNKADIDHLAADGLNPLQRAFSDGSLQNANLPIVKLLLKNGADANEFCDPSKRLTVLHQAVIKNNRELVIHLLQHKAKTSTRDETGRTAVEYDKDGGMVDLLVKDSLRKQNACGRDLICAARFFKVDLVRELIESGVDVNSRDSNGQTALHAVQESAAEGYDGRDEKIVKLLLKAGANPYMPDNDLRTPISSIDYCNSGIACLYEKYCMVPRKNGPTSLHQAVARDSLTIVKDLLADDGRRSRINKRDKLGFTALHYAVLWGHSHEEDIVQHLIDAEANLNTPDMYGCTSLHYAVGVCNWPLTKLILGAGGDLDATDEKGRRPADIAILRMDLDLYKMLMARCSRKRNDQILNDAG
jgi:ankyrin repeat protein